MSGYFIAGTDTGVGKTRATAGLLRGLVELGLQPRGMKPVSAGGNEDATMIAAVTGQIADDVNLNPYNLAEPLSPHIAAENAGICIDIKRICTAYAALTAESGIVLVEGAGGWLSPISDDQTMADIAVALRLPVLLVVGLRLGCLNHALLTAQAIRASGLALAGWLGSQPQRGFAASEANLRTLSQWLGSTPLAVLPWQPDTSRDAGIFKPAARQLARQCKLLDR